MVGGVHHAFGVIHKWAGRGWGGSYKQRRVFIDNNILVTQEGTTEPLGLNLDLNTVTLIRLGSAQKDDTDGFTIQIDHPRRVSGSRSEWFWSPDRVLINRIAETIADYTPKTPMIVMKRGLSHGDAQFKNIDATHVRDAGGIMTLPEGARVDALDAFHITLHGANIEYTRVLVGEVKGYVATNLLRRPTVEESEEAALTQVATQQDRVAPDMGGAAAAAPTPPEKKQTSTDDRDRFDRGAAKSPASLVKEQKSTELDRFDRGASKEVLS